MAYYRRASAQIAAIVDPEEWMPSAFADMVEKKVHFCVTINDEIVSATTFENLATMPQKLIDMGIYTLAEHRRKGYAASSCAAFIKHHLQEGLLTVWHRELDNHPSALLAEKLGFRHLGNEFSVFTMGEV